MTEKDILKDIRESFEASGDHLSDDFLRNADLRRENRNVTLSGRKNRFPVIAACASAAAVFSLLVAFHFYDLGRKYDHELMLPDITSGNNDLHDFTGNDMYTNAEKNTTAGERTAAYSTPENSTDLPSGIFSYEVITSGDNTGSAGKSETESQQRQTDAHAASQTKPYTVPFTEGMHTTPRQNTETQAYTVPVTVNASTEPWWNIGTYPCTTEATTKAEPATEPWWNIGTYPVTTEATTRSRPVTEPIGTYPCTTEAEPATEPWWNIGTYPCTTEAEPVCTTDCVTEAYTETPAESTDADDINFYISSGSEWDENEDPLIIEDDRFFYSIPHPGKYTVVFDGGYRCTLKYAVINGLVTTEELLIAHVPYTKVTFKN
ncbi:hypothetical protein [Ruminococcus sp. HUN007]|uniref:hypothetical protein n=1 Tax=Ruminococcus sp. HUN007 TaxID=1514668 RepID=UPI0005D2B332|nr:hypothetical protein [Ruminococcus sp. HUN007]